MKTLRELLKESGKDKEAFKASASKAAGLQYQSSKAPSGELHTDHQKMLDAGHKESDFV